MTIHIIREPDIHLTQADYDRLHREWQSCQQYTTAPCSFEAYVRAHRHKEQQDLTDEQVRLFAAMGRSM